MKEISFASSKVEANRCGKSPEFSSEVPAPFRGSLNEMPLRFIPVITWLTKRNNERINGTGNPIIKNRIFPREFRSGSVPK